VRASSEKNALEKMSTPSLPPFITTFPVAVLPAYLRGTGPGGGGSYFPSSSAARRDQVLLPSAAPLIILKWPRALIGRTLKVFANADAFPDAPLMITTIPAHRRTALSGIFADVTVPSGIAGLIAIASADGLSMEVFQLSWKSLRVGGCAPVNIEEFQFVAASAPLESNAAVSSALSVLNVSTLISNPVHDFPWPWLVVCQVVQEPPVPTSESAALFSTLSTRLR
jgi:hypothetical protein